MFVKYVNAFVDQMFFFPRYWGQTWSYEHFDMARPHLQNHDRAFPRVCRWDHSKSHPRQRSTSRFKDLHEDQVTLKLAYKLLNAEFKDSLTPCIT